MYLTVYKWQVIYFCVVTQKRSHYTASLDMKADI